MTFHSADADLALDSLRVATQAGHGLVALVSRTGPWAVTKALPGWDGLRVTHVPTGRMLPGVEPSDSAHHRKLLGRLTARLDALVPEFDRADLAPRETIARVVGAWMEET